MNRENLIRKDYQYRFNGELLKTRITKGTSVKILTYEYDHVGRKTKFKHSLNGNEKTIAKYVYDEIGRLKSKQFSPTSAIASLQTGNWTTTSTWQGGLLPTLSDNVSINAGHTITIPTGQTATAGSLYNAGTLQNYGTLNLGSLSGNATAGTLQTLDYKYHIRGGLLGINLDANNNLTTSLFSYKLTYEEDGTYYDGNIRKQSWKSNLDNKERSFTYTYDGASRIKSAVYASQIIGENYALNSVNYDRNGNITTLSRNGLKSNSTFGLIDNLAYAYNANSNKILKVDDISNETASFKDITGNDYAYWEDGSLKNDNNKEITQIEYNFLKLPKKISLTNNRWISYEYDASGLKLKKTLSTGKVTEYEEDEVYEDAVLYQTIHDEGRIVNGVYEYNIKDHLGNLRVAFKDSSGVAKITQSNAYGAWGEDLPTLSYQNTPKISKFTYSTYEKENDFGIGLLDAHARLFDNIVPHFLQIDPLAEKYFGVSPYVFVLNRPTVAIDPDGKRFFFVAGAGNDGAGWNYIKRWQNEFTQGGINNFIPLNASHDNPNGIRNGMGTPINDILFTASNRNYSYESGTSMGFDVPVTSSIQDKQVDKAYNDIKNNLRSNPLEKGEQLNLGGYSYGSVLQAHIALKLANSGVKVDNLVLVGSPISTESELFKSLSSHKNIGKVLRIDIKNDLLSNPKDIFDFIQGGKQNSDPNNTGEGPHFDLARPGKETSERIKNVVVEWLKQQGVK